MNPEENNNPLTNGPSPEPVVPDPVAADTGAPTPVEPSADTADSASTSVEAPFGAVDTIPTAEPSANEPTGTAEFVDGNPVSEKSVETDTETAEPIEPIEPSAPLPGSIGSAMSGPTAEVTPTPEVSPTTETTSSIGSESTETPEPTAPLGATADVAPTTMPTESVAPTSPMPTMPGPMAAGGAPKTKKSRTTTILLIALAAIAVVAGIVAVILLTQKPKEQPVTNQNAENTTGKEEITETNLVCKVSSAETGELIEDIEGLTAYDRELVAEYINDELDTISSKDTFTFSDTELANNFSTIQQADYVNSYTSLGFDADPFKSSFKVTDTIAAITHKAKFEELSTKNMAIFSLQTDEDGEVKTSVSSIKKIYEKLGYKCTLNDSTEESEKTEELTEDAPAEEE